MTVTKQAVSIGETRVTDINAIYAQVIGLLSSSQDIDLKDVLSHELALVSTSMVTGGDGIKIVKNKSQLKRSLLQVEVSSTPCPEKNGTNNVLSITLTNTNV